ncbi:MAG TPA: hypothetical protein VFR41_15250 [Acidimicrobiia bacterium]|nr:hypothetical protein [Acidimicrobiia bacterium]
MGAFDEPSSYLIEGRLLRYGRVARGLRDASPAQRRMVGRWFVWAIGAIAAVFAASWALGRFF